jgi:hypothetical protein
MRSRVEQGGAAFDAWTIAFVQKEFGQVTIRLAVCRDEGDFFMEALGSVMRPGRLADWDRR